MSTSSIAAWPPPPDLESIKELVRDADVEGFIADGSPADEYDTEAEELHEGIAHLVSEEITVGRLMPLIEAIWRKNLVDDDAELAERRPGLEGIAAQIARFFGAEAKPQTRGQ
ncbi:hypothetical protein [Granulicella arctica]|uniref:hypothetical protein n=1 Tax=Granulicella arctica TaxID=940613 RepID=UPI0021DFC013|nr:hypothetical protein [Granulicella arctica]